MSGNWVANAAFFKTTAGHKLGIGHREKINDINLYFPSYFERLTSMLSKSKNEASSITVPIFFQKIHHQKNHHNLKPYLYQ